MLTQNCNENLSLGRRAFQNWQLDRAEQYLSHAYMLAQVENMIHLEIAAGVLLCDLYATLSEQYSAAHDTDRARAATLETLKHAHYMQTPSEEIEVLLSATARYRQLATEDAAPRPYLLRAKQLAAETRAEQLLTVLENLAGFERDLGNYADAIAHAEMIWSLTHHAKQTDSGAGKHARGSLYLQADCYAKDGQLQKAVALCDAGLALAQPATGEITFFALVELAAACEARLGNLQAAIGYFERLQQVQATDDNLRGYRKAMTEYGQFLVGNNFDQEAIAVIEHLLPFYARQPFPLEHARNYHNLSSAYFNIKALDKAVAAEEQALHFYQLAGSDKGISIARFSLESIRKAQKESTIDSDQVLNRWVEAHTPSLETKMSMMPRSSLRNQLMQAILAKDTDALMDKLSGRSTPDDDASSDKATSAEDLLRSFAGLGPSNGGYGFVSELYPSATFEHRTEAESRAMVSQVQDMLGSAKNLDALQHVPKLTNYIIKSDAEFVKGYLPQYVREHPNALGFLTAALIESALNDVERAGISFEKASTAATSLQDRFAVAYFYAHFYADQNQMEHAVQHYRNAIEILDESRAVASTDADDRQRFVDSNIIIIEETLNLLYEQQDVSSCLWAMEYFRSRTLVEKRDDSGMVDFTASIDKLLQLVMDEKFAVMSFYQTRRATFMAVISPTMRAIYRFKHTARNIPELAERYVASLQPTGDIHEWLTGGLDWSAQELFEALMEPWFLDVEDTIHELVVVPHGATAKLPFGALPHLYKPYVYLIDAVPIVYTPNLSLLYADTLRPTSPAAGHFVGVGVSHFLNGLPPLAGTIPEVKTIAQLFESARIFTDEAGATVGAGAVLQALPHATTAHFATHAEAQTDQPFQAWMHLSTEKLSAQAVLELSRAPDIVTLGACSSNLGFSSPSEGMQGLAYAFMMAGTRSIVSTLWNVLDDVSVTFFESFYEMVHQDKKLSIVLSEAIKSVRKMTIEQLPEGFQCDHPYFWAPFLLYSTNLTN